MDNSVTLETGRKAILIGLTVRSSVPCHLKIVGRDANHLNTVFFNRGYGVNERRFYGQKVFYFPMPLTPEFLFIELSSDVPHARLTIDDISFLPLEKEQLWLREDEREFLKFAVNFALKASHIPTGAYQDEDDKFIIMYKDGITNNQTGRKEDTPARISRSTGIIEINREKFKNYTVPMRIIVLLHEFCHWRLKTRNELECDFNAINIFLKMGFPKTEALYAFTKVFVDKDTPVLQDRVNNIYNFINNWKFERDRSAIDEG